MEISIKALQYWTLLLIPFLLWASYHYYKDQHKPEPVLLLLLASLLGYGSAYIGLELYAALEFFGLRYNAYELAQTSSLSLFLYSILVIGPIEELAKLIPFILIIIHLPHFDEPLDGIIYASFIALGFSIHENADYLSFMQGWQAAGRALASPLVHIMFASIWGFAYSYADTRKLNRIAWTMGGFILASFIHGIYDFFAISISSWSHAVPPLLILFIWLWRMNIFHKNKQETNAPG